MHHRYRPGDYETLQYIAPMHWCSSGFANTDLDLQLKKHDIRQLIVIGLIAHTCVEATVRYAAELGYNVTVVRDATADYSDEMMHAALGINLPNYASAIVTTREIVDSILSLESRRGRRECGVDRYIARELDLSLAREVVPRSPTIKERHPCGQH